MIRIRTQLGAAMASAIFGATLLAAPAAAVTPITFYIYVNGTCQNGSGQASTTFTVRLLAPNGDLVQRMSATSNGSGYWYACFGSAVAPGDKIRATGGGADRTVTVPSLSMNGNRVSDVVSGHWIPSTALNVCITHYSAFNSTSQICLGGTSDGGGSYSIDFTSEFNVRGGDYAAATYTSGADTFTAYTTFAYMEVYRADAYVQGALNRGQTATLTLKDGASNVRGTATVQGDYGNSFDGSFHTSSGSTVRPRATDKVVGSFASDANITIPDVKVSGVASTDVVSGKCLPNRPYELYARKADYSDSTTRFGTADGSGNFSQDLTADINLAMWDPVQIRCLYISGERIVAKGYVTS